MKTPPKRRDLIGEVSPPEPPVPPAKRRSKTLAEGRKPGSGRPVGSKDQVLEELRVAIVHVYAELGGEAWLKRFAKEYPEAFATKILNRILPPTPKDPDVLVQQSGLTVYELNQIRDDDFEVARRIAFLLSSGNEALKAKLATENRLIEADVIQQPVRLPRPPYVAPQDLPPLGQCSEVELAKLMQQEQRQSVNALVRDTIDGTYRGSPEEQGRGRRRNLF